MFVIESALHKLAETTGRDLRDIQFKNLLQDGDEWCCTVCGIVWKLGDEEPVTDYSTAAASDTRKYAAFFHGMLKRGVYLAPSQFEAAFVSLAHTEKDIEKTILAAEQSLLEIA